MYKVKWCEKKVSICEQFITCENPRESGNKGGRWTLTFTRMKNIKSLDSCQVQSHVLGIEVQKVIYPSNKTFSQGKKRAELV